ncbi:hypothetical protein ACR6C2_08300 [Streptomyces sp. INA 01156]
MAAGGTWADFANGLGDVGKSMTTDTGLGDPGLGGSAVLMLLIAWVWPWKKRMLWPALLSLMGAVLASQAVCPASSSASSARSSRSTREADMAVDLTSPESDPGPGPEPAAAEEECAPLTAREELMVPLKAFAGAVVAGSPLLARRIAGVVWQGVREASQAQSSTTKGGDRRRRGEDAAREEG